MVRASMSTLPPGVLGTMTRIGFVGYVCAAVCAAAQTTASAVINPDFHRVTFMVSRRASILRV